MTLKEFKDGVEIKNPIHVNRSTQGCDWCFGDIYLLHERAHFPWSPFNEITVSYWGNTVYTDLALANSEAEKYGAAVEMCFYCDENNPTWFLIFHDNDKALEQCFNQLVKEGKINA